MTRAEKTVETTTADGIAFKTPVGIDGKNPVSPNNPPAKAVAPDEPKQPKEKGIEDAKAPITPNNPASEKSQGFVSDDVAWLPNTQVTDNSPNEVSNPAAEPLEDVQNSVGAAEDFQYSETAAGTYVDDDGVVKALAVGDDAPEPDEKTGVVEGTPVSDHSSNSEPTANESEAERVAREQRETLEKAEQERLAALDATRKEQADEAAAQEQADKDAADKKAADEKAAKEKAAADKKAAASAKKS